MNKKSILIIIVVSIILGVIVVRQFNLSKKIQKEVTIENNEMLAYEVSELFKSNDSLKIEIEKLEDEFNKFQTTFIDSKDTQQTLDKKIHDYQIILGLAKVRGPGVKIDFDKKIASVQIIDLMNTLKNIGVEAISINNKRVVPTSSIKEGIFSPPIIVEAIGNNEIIYNSLVRPGGIIDQIGYGQVTVVDDMIIQGIE
jgi:uncharacterized protein YlxW (UPF0749 family)